MSKLSTDPECEIRKLEGHRPTIDFGDKEGPESPNREIGPRS